MGPFFWHNAAHAMCQTQVLEGVAANGGTYIAAMDRSASANFVMRVQNQEQRKKSTLPLGRQKTSSHGTASFWTVDGNLVELCSRCANMQLSVALVV